MTVPGDAIVPRVATFWHGTLDRLRLACLRSQVAAGHKVVVYSFEPLTNLPDGVENTDAEPVLSKRFAEKIRPQPADGQWTQRTAVQFSDFFRMALLAQDKGLWLDADVLLLKPVMISPPKPLLNWANDRSLDWTAVPRLNNAVLYLAPDNPIVTAFMQFIAQDELVPVWLSLSHRVTFALNRLTGRTKYLGDMRIAIFGPAALTALAKRTQQIDQALPLKSFHAIHAQPNLFFDPSDFQTLLNDPEIAGFHISTQGRSGETPVPGSFNAWVQERFG